MTPGKNVFFRITRHRVGRHFLFWIAILLAAIIAKTSAEAPEQGFFDLLGKNTINLIAPLIGAYFLNYYLLPKLYYPKKYLSFFFLFVLSAYLISVLARIINVHIAEPLFRTGDFEQENITQILVQLEHLITVYFPAIYFVAFAMTLLKQQKAHAEMKQRNTLLEKEKAETELNFLKAQIHPHFLFNTLNNLYALTLKKSDQAPEVVEKLSEILDYILYRGKDRFVIVEKEIKLLENYILLEKLRYGDQLKISFSRRVDDMQIGISPLLLLSIVENAFKHGASGQLSEAEIKIELTVNNNQLFFQAYNTKGGNVKTDNATYRKGIGVSNIKRQLALIYADHNFEIEEGKDFYLVTLFINLKEIR